MATGGMSTVYHVFDRERGQDVALKRSNECQSDELHPLTCEFRRLAALSYPNLVRAYDLFDNDNEPFFTMELVDGADFVSFARGSSGAGSCDFERLRHAARHLARTIRWIHAAGLVHRDIKPSNVLVTEAGRVVLIDLGLAQELSPESREVAGSGALLGTSGYVAPEQARGETVGKAADWYGFGVTLFEAATGRLPFRNMFETLVASRSSKLIPSIRRHTVGAPLDLDEFIVALLDPCAGRRPSGDEVVRALGDFDEIGCTGTLNR